MPSDDLIEVSLVGSGEVYLRVTAVCALMFRCADRLVSDPVYGDAAAAAVVAASEIRHLAEELADAAEAHQARARADVDSHLGESPGHPLDGAGADPRVRVSTSLLCSARDAETLAARLDTAARRIAYAARPSVVTVSGSGYDGPPPPPDSVDQPVTTAWL